MAQVRYLILIPFNSKELNVEVTTMPLKRRAFQLKLKDFGYTGILKVGLYVEKQTNYVIFVAHGNKSQNLINIGVKTLKMHFYFFFELTLDSLMTI